MKACFKCHERKPLADFYKHSRMADGHLGKCKECTKRDVNENRQIRIGYYREYDRERGNRITADGTRRYRALNPEKYLAHSLVNSAIRCGRLVWAPCMICGRHDSHAHHDNYTRPLDVTWLCPVHHFERHKYLSTSTRPALVGRKTTEKGNRNG